MKKISNNLLIAAQYLKPPTRWEFWAVIVIALAVLTIILPYTIQSAVQANSDYYTTFGLDNGR